MNSLIEIKRNLPAFLIAPAVPIFLVALVAVVSGGLGAGWLIIFAALVAYGLTFILGIPIYLILKKLGIWGPVSLIICGTIISTIPIYYFVISPRLALMQKGLVESLFTHSVLLQMSIFFALSLVGVMVFWFMLKTIEKR